MAPALTPLPYRYFVRLGSGLLALLLTAALFLTFSLQQSQIRDITTTPPNGSDHSLRDLPHEGYVAAGLERYAFALHQRPFSGTRFRVIGYPCVESLVVNGLALDLTTLAPTERCAYYDGFVVDLSEHLAAGVHLIEATVAAPKGYVKFSFVPAPGGPRIGILWIAVVGAFGLTLFTLRPFLRLPNVYLLLWTGAVAVRLLYLHENLPLERSHDLTGHLEYLDRIEATGVTPGTMDCWSCFHPPLYYHLAVAWRAWMATLWDLPPDRALQVLSLILDLGLIFCGAHCLRRLFAKIPPLGPLAFAVLAFWPGAIVWSIRIGNDNLLYPLLAFALWRLLCWSEKGRWGDFVLTAVAVGLALNTKSNAIIIGPVLLTVFFVRHLAARPFAWQRLATESAVAGGLLLLAFAVAAYRPWVATQAGQQEDFLVGNSPKLNPLLAVPNDVEHLLGLHLGHYLEDPFIPLEWDDRRDRSFPNYYAKTALFGEHRWEVPAVRRLIAYLPLLLLLGGIPWIVAGFPRLRHLGAPHRWWLIGGTGWLLLAAWLYRIHLPSRPCGDFRFTAPIFIFFSAWAVLPIHPSAPRWLRWTGIAGVALWVVSCVLFFVVAHVPGVGAATLATIP